MERGQVWVGKKVFTPKPTLKYEHSAKLCSLWKGRLEEEERSWIFPGRPQVSRSPCLLSLAKWEQPQVCAPAAKTLNVLQSTLIHYTAGRSGSEPVSSFSSPLTEHKERGWEAEQKHQEQLLSQQHVRPTHKEMFHVHVQSYWTYYNPLSHVSVRLSGPKISLL